MTSVQSVQLLSVGDKSTTQLMVHVHPVNQEALKQKQNYLRYSN